MEGLTNQNTAGNLLLERRAEAPLASELARHVVDIVSDRKASDIILMDIRSMSYLSDYFVICTAESERQIKAIVDALMENLRAIGVRPLSVEGQSASGWVILDYGDVIVHVFSPAMRDYYKLDKVWSQATLVLRVQ